MTCLDIPSLRRNGVYYHHAAIPLDIKDTYPKTDETFSLRTRDLREAVIGVRKAVAEVDARFAEHRRGQNTTLFLRDDVTEPTTLKRRACQ